MKPRTETSQYLAPGNNRLRTRAIRTLLAEDSPLLMALLARIASRNQRVFIVGSATDGRKALWNTIQEFFPDDLEPNDAEPKHLYESLTTVE